MVVDIHQERVIFSKPGGSELNHCEIGGTTYPCATNYATEVLPGATGSEPYVHDEVALNGVIEPSGARGVWAYHFPTTQGGMLANGSANVRLAPAGLSSEHLFWKALDPNPLDFMGALYAVSLTGRFTTVSAEKNCAIVGRTDEQRVPWVRIDLAANKAEIVVSNYDDLSPLWMVRDPN